MIMKLIEGEIILTSPGGSFSIGSIITGASSGIHAKVMGIAGDTTLLIMILPFRLERQFNNVLFKMFER